MVVDSSAAAEVLGWRPRTSLAEGLALTVKAMRET
jgi:nucleoside-diphosphate-sugar epimerase